MIACGSVVAIRAGMLEARVPGAAVGDGVRVWAPHGRLYGSVIALSDGTAFIAPGGDLEGVAAGHEVWIDAAAHAAPLGLCALGRAFDASCKSIDGKPPLQRLRNVCVRAPLPAARRAIRKPFWTGVRAIDGLLTLGIGARVGIFGLPGTGKSSLLHALMRGSHADAVVVALVGERGREAEEWIRVAPEHATIYCATGERSAAERVRVAAIAMAQASELRSRDLHVLLLVDSLARLAAAHREIAVACGESAGRGGYPPRVFAQLAAFTEIAGSCEHGSITLVATVLHDGDDRDPVSEAARALLDGHIQLCIELANAGRFPAIDLPASVSRTMYDVVSEDHREAARIVRSAIAELDHSKEARAIGIAPAHDRALRAIAAEDAIEAFLRQTQSDRPPATVKWLREIAAAIESRS